MEDGIFFGRSNGLSFSFVRSSLFRDGRFPVHLVVGTSKELVPVLDVLRVKEEYSLVCRRRFRFGVVEGWIVEWVLVFCFESNRFLLPFLRNNVEEFFPDTRCPLPRSIHRSFRFRVEQETPTTPTVRFDYQLPQHLLVPLEPFRELSLNLIDTIEELLENGTSLFERVTRTGELFLYRSEERLLSGCVFSELLVKLDSVVTEVS